MNATRARSQRWKPVAVAFGAATIVAATGATITDLGPWYQSLHQPWWKPPDLLFGPAWTIIFALTAASAARAWRDIRDPASRPWVVGLFSLNGVLNLTWSALFFRFERPAWALCEVPLLWLSILGLIVFLAKKSKTASRLLIPYQLWVTFAAALNAAVVSLNPLNPG